jgi:hypothetical protein
LGIKSAGALQKHPAYGFIFENWLITEIKKNSFNAGLDENLYYFRDNLENEVDLILERDEHPMAIEIKSTTKPNSNMLRGLNFWQKNQPHGNGILIHQGTANELINDRLSIVPWTEIANL